MAINVSLLTQYSIFSRYTMRPLEIILIIVILTAALVQLKNANPRWPNVLTFIGILVAICYAVRDGVPWQMFPVFVGLLLLLICQSRGIRSTRKTLFVSSIMALSVLSFVLLLLVPMFTLPKPTGPYQVGTRIIYLKDTSRIEDQGTQPGLPRELMVQIWYPADPSNNHLAVYQRRSETTLGTSYRSVLSTNSRVDAPIAIQGNPFFVLLFNHGWGGRRTQDTFLTEDLASHGYVVAAIDHTYNAGRVAMPDHRVIDDAFGFDPINPEVRTAAQIRDVWNKELNKWVADESFVLSMLQNDNLDKTSPWYGRLNTTSVGAFGHSFGGAASVQICSTDPRVRAGLNMDGWTFGDISHRQPNDLLMFIYETASTPQPQYLNSKDRATRIGTELDVNDMEQVDSSLKQDGGYKLFVDGTSHMDFTDHSLVFPWREWKDRDHISPARIQTIVRAYVLAFFDKTLRGEAPALLLDGNKSPFHEVHIEQFIPDQKSVPAEPTAKSQLDGQ
jgi:predicted dienelactone hydrolase